MPTTANYRVCEIGGIPVGEFHLQSDSGVNPLSSGVVTSINERLRSLDTIEPPLAILFRASGRCFSAGADLKEFKNITTDGFRQFMTDILAMYAAMAEVRKPVISLVHADARGGGAAVALFSDFVIAAEGAQFALPESHRGLAGGGYLMPRLIGKQRAAEMVLLGRSYSAAEMLQMGLVNEVCPSEELDERCAALCAELGKLSPGAFAVGKRSLAGGLFVGMREAMAIHVEAQTEAFLLARSKGML
jgi:enoyl-CoA hydratase/carnithine racemase